MSSIVEIEQAIERLSPEELVEFRAWFSARDAQIWDRQFEEDVANGRLDAMAEQAIRDFREGRCVDL